MHFLDDVLSQDMAHIDDLFFLGNCLGHFVFMCSSSISLFYMDSTSFFFLVF
jgi:hypothetical protein